MNYCSVFLLWRLSYNWISSHKTAKSNNNEYLFICNHCLLRHTGPNQFHPECGKHIEKEKKKRKTLFKKIFGHTTCGILVPRPGMEPCPLHQKQGVLITGPPEKSPEGNNFRKNHLPEVNWEFPGGPMFRTWWFLWGGPDLIPGQKTKIRQHIQCSQKKN